MKQDAGKNRMSLVPIGVLDEVLAVLEHGAKKYGDNDWKSLENARTRYYDAACRHLKAWWEGESADPESGYHHLAHMICCAIFLIWFDWNR